MDIGVAIEILDAAYASSGGALPSLLQVLKAYESVLQRRGISTSADGGTYRLLLAASLQQPTSWYEKLHREATRLGLPTDLRLRGRLADDAMRTQPRAPDPPLSRHAAASVAAPSSGRGLSALSIGGNSVASVSLDRSSFVHHTVAAATAGPPRVSTPASVLSSSSVVRPSLASPWSSSTLPADASVGPAMAPRIKPLPDDDYGIRAPNGASMADFLRYRRKARFFRRCAMLRVTPHL
jgi:hypothetical protein